MSHEPTEQSIMTTEEKNAQAAEKPGDVLRRVRQSLGLTEDEIAIQMRLSHEVVNAIEANAFETLHGLTFARGYIRAYAKLLNIPVEPLLEAFNNLYPEPPEFAPTTARPYVTQKRYMKLHRRGHIHKDNTVKWVGYGLFVVISILGLMWWHSRSLSPQTIAMVNPASSTHGASHTAIQANAPASATPATTGLASSFSAPAVANDNTIALPNTSNMDGSGVSTLNVGPSTATAPTTNPATNNVTNAVSNQPTSVVAKTTVPATGAQTGSSAASGWHNPDLTNHQ